MQVRNELKNLIYIQDNKPCNERTINGLFRSVVEPILEKNVEGVVLCRLEEKSKKNYSSILKRLEFSNAEVYDFSDEPISEKFKNVLKDKIWDKTEFIYVLAERFVAVLIFDYDESELDGYAQAYMLHNSRNLSDTFDIINANSTEDLSRFQEFWRPERRNNTILNSSIRKIIENLNDSNQEMMITQLENEKAENLEDAASRLNFLLAKSSYISHEMRNLFSICNLYSTIIEKQTNRAKFEDKELEASIYNASACIKKSLVMAGNLLLDFKSMRAIALKDLDLKSLIDSAVVLSKVYTEGRNITFENKFETDVNVLVDENKFLSVLINMLKNAVESIGAENENVGHIVVDGRACAENVQITISSNGQPIAKELQEKIFEEGFTTKSTGSGLGLVICKKTLEEQFAQMRLIKSDNESTDFEITVLKSEK